MKVGFAKAEIDARTASEETKAVTVAPEGQAPPVADEQLVTEDHASTLRGENEFDARDLNLPYIALVQKTSELIDQIEGLRAGAFVFNKEVILTPDSKTPVSVIITKFDKVYEEEVEFGAEERPQMFKTIAEARAAGFDEEYGSEKRVVRRADMTFLVKAPETLSEVHAGMFPFEVEGAFYALGKFTARKGAYATTAKVAFSLLKLGTFLERNGVKAWYHGSFDLTSALKTNEKNSWHQPVLKPAKKTSDALVEFIETIQGKG